jgi:uncharacterized protein with von Willebrand factor type A (vWA) domain
MTSAWRSGQSIRLPIAGHRQPHSLILTPACKLLSLRESSSLIGLGDGLDKDDSDVVDDLARCATRLAKDQAWVTAARRELVNKKIVLGVRIAHRHRGD